MQFSFVYITLLGGIDLQRPPRSLSTKRPPRVINPCGSGSNSPKTSSLLNHRRRRNDFTNATGLRGCVCMLSQHPPHAKKPKKPIRIISHQIKAHWRHLKAPAWRFDHTISRGLPDPPLSPASARPPSGSPASRTQSVHSRTTSR